MKKIYLVNCGKYGKFKILKIYIFQRTVFSIICDKCGHKHKRKFKEKESSEILRILSFINNI